MNESLPTAMRDLLASAERVLALGIGGGGDVAGALAVAEMAGAAGTPSVLGGLTWERRPIDPLPGPRRLDEIEGAEIMHPAAALAGPATAGPGGFLFAESHMAAFLGEPTVLIDINDGPRAVAAGVVAAAERLGCDLVVLLDVGGDVLAHGDEPTLASPLADAVVLASAPGIAAAGLRVVGAVFGAGCDGELTPDEVRARLDEVRAAGGLIGSALPTPEQLDRLEGALALVPTEASTMAVRAARGETGVTMIRDGRRSVRLTPEGGAVHLFEADAAIASAARLARAVQDAGSLREAHDILTAIGVRTELAFESEAARPG
jgi:hypothetical protein